MLRMTLAAAASFFTACPAHAGDADAFCTKQPQARWLSPAAISVKAAEAGYRNVRRIVVQGSCYEIFASTVSDGRADVMMNPVTGDVVRAEMRE